MLLDDAQLIAVAQIQGVNAFRFGIGDKWIALPCRPVCLRERCLPSHVVVNTIQNFGQRIPRPQPVEAEVAFCSGRFQCRIFEGLPIRGAGLERVAHGLHSLLKILLGGGGQNGTVNVGADDAAQGGFALFFGGPFAVGLAPAFGIPNYGQAILFAERVRHSLHFLIILFGAVVLDAVHKGHRVDDKVGMQMVGTIQMSCNKHLIPVSPKLPRQLDPNLMGNLRGGLSGGEGLVAVVGNDTILFPVEFLDLLHLHFGGTGIAVDTGHKPLNDFLTVPHLGLAGLVLLDGIVNDIGQVAITGGNGGGFLRVFHIVQNLPDAAMNTPDGCNGHGSVLHRHGIKNR